MRRTSAQWPPRNENASNRQGKITHLLSIILDNCQSLSDWDHDFVTDMKRLINRRRGIEPATALSEKQAHTLRKIIFRRYRDYKHAVPSLPAGVKFEDEVRRLLKSQPNPNEARNELIRKAKALLGRYLEDYAERNEWWDGEQRIGDMRYKKIEGDVLTFEVEMIVSEGGNYTSTYKVNVDTNEVQGAGLMNYRY